ncbi:hypothetical protein HK102_003749, partial [Quaeritorhiza haematococci]
MALSFIRGTTCPPPLLLDESCNCITSKDHPYMQFSTVLSNDFRNIDTKEETFRIEFHVFDSDHNPMPRTEVTISLAEGNKEEEILYMDDDGIRSIVLKGSESLTLVTNFQGVEQIGVVAKDQKIDSALLKFTADVLPPKTFYVIEPNADVLSHLAQAKNADSKDGKVRDLREAIGDAGKADLIGAMFEKVAVNAAAQGAGAMEQQRRRRLMKRNNNNSGFGMYDDTSSTASEVEWVSAHVRYDLETGYLLPHFIHEEYGLVPYELSLHHHLGGVPMGLEKRWSFGRKLKEKLKKAGQKIKEIAKKTTNAIAHGFRTGIDKIEDGMEWLKKQVKEAGEDAGRFVVDSWKVVSDGIEVAIKTVEKVYNIVVKTVKEAALVLKVILQKVFAKIWEILKSWFFILTNIKNNIELNELVFTNMMDVLPSELPKYKDTLDNTFDTVKTRLQQLFGVHDNEDFQQREQTEFRFRNQSRPANAIGGLLQKALDKLPELPMPPLFKKIEKLMMALSVFDARSLLSELLPYRGFPSFDMDSISNFKLPSFDKKTLIRELAGKLTNVVHLAATIIRTGIDTFGHIAAKLKDVLFARINLGWISDIIEKILLRGKRLSLARMLWIWGSFPGVFSMTLWAVPMVSKSRLQEFKQMPPQVFLGIEPPSPSDPPALTKQERLSTALAVRSTVMSTHSLRVLTCFLEVQNFNISKRYRFRAWTNVTHPIEYLYNSIAVFQLFEFTGNVALGISSGLMFHAVGTQVDRMDEGQKRVVNGLWYSRVVMTIIDNLVINCDAFWDYRSKHGLKFKPVRAPDGRELEFVEGEEEHSSFDIFRSATDFIRSQIQSWIFSKSRIQAIWKVVYPTLDITAQFFLFDLNTQLRSSPHVNADLVLNSAYQAAELQQAVVEHAAGMAKMFCKKKFKKVKEFKIKLLACMKIEIVTG